MASICTFCAASEGIKPRHRQLAHAVGVELARRGHRLVSGGAHLSMMGDVARGARDGGARTVGVFPRGLPSDVADAQAHELRLVDDLRARKAEMAQRADAFLILPGGLGTLDELFDVWVQRTLGFHAKPLVMLDPDGVFGKLRDLVEDLTSQGFIQQTTSHSLTLAHSIVEAFELIESILAAGSPRSHVGDTPTVDLKACRGWGEPSRSRTRYTGS